MHECSGAGTGTFTEPAPKMCETCAMDAEIGCSNVMYGVPFSHRIQYSVFGLPLSAGTSPVTEIAASVTRRVPEDAPGNASAP